MLQVELEEDQCRGRAMQGLDSTVSRRRQRTRAGEAQVGTDLLRPAC